MDWEEWVNATGRQASNDDHAGVQSIEKRECLTFIQNSSGNGVAPFGFGNHDTGPLGRQRRAN